MKQYALSLCGEYYRHQDHDNSDHDDNWMAMMLMVFEFACRFDVGNKRFYFYRVLAFTYSSSISNLIASSSTLCLANGITKRLLARARRIDETEGLEMTFSKTIKTHEQADNILSITRSVYKPVEQRKYRLRLT